jgi:hypothetical protein
MNDKNGKEEQWALDKSLRNSLRGVEEVVKAGDVKTLLANQSRIWCHAVLASR